MSHYAIGDIQGCMDPLQRLLQRIQFDPQHDVLWLVGDLVNRGPQSLEVLRWAYALGDGVVAVLGNHDLRLLSIAQGVCTPHPTDTLDAILRAPDADRLLAWLQARPLVVRRQKHAMVHAGVLPAWSIDDALAKSDEVQRVLSGPRARTFLQHLGHEVPHHTSMNELDTWVFNTKVLTYMRVCKNDGTLFLDFTGKPEQAPPGFAPWFAASHRRNQDVTWVCGHWAALGLHRDNNVRALDTGCVWGGALTALRLEDDTIFQEPA